MRVTFNIATGRDNGRSSPLRWSRYHPPVAVDGHHVIPDIIVHVFYIGQIGLCKIEIDAK
jgi:hypothetical protein